MSEELADEVEAINSIFGPNTILPAPTQSLTQDPSQDVALDYILSLPRDASSLRLRFDANYPNSSAAAAAAPLEVLGTHSASHGIKGAGQRDVRLFRDAVRKVFQTGSVCLFDALEEFERVYEEEGLGDEDNDDSPGSGLPESAGKDHEQETRSSGWGGITGEDGKEEAAEEDIPWIVSDVVVDTKSTFVAHVAPVSSPAQARRYVSRLLDSDKRIRAATHNITAWRMRGSSTPQPTTGAGSSLRTKKEGEDQEAGNPVGNSTTTTTTQYQDCDDDGETAAGGRLLHLMQVMDVWDAMVVVTRWYGGVKLGPKRFAVINAVARDAFVKAGMVKKDGKKGKS